MTQSKGIQQRKRARTTSEKAGSRGTKVSEHGAKTLMALAKTLYDDHKQAHREAGINRPSSRVALDYLITQAMIHGVEEMAKMSTKGNLWLEIGPVPQEE